MLDIKVNNIDISDRITSIESYYELPSDKLIGTISSLQIKLTVKNEDNLLNDLMDYPFIIDGNTYYIYERPEKWTKTVSLTLYDGVFKSNVKYISNLENPTVSMQLDEIEQIIGLKIDKSSISDHILERHVSWYDSNETIRTYLGWICECDGKNGFVINDMLTFKKLGENVHETDFCSNYDINELVQISKILFDDGIRNLSNGTDVGKTIVLDSLNPYITDYDVEYIYHSYNGLTFYSFKQLSTFDIEGLLPADLVLYDGLMFLPLSIKIKYLGGEAQNSLELSGDLSLKANDGIITKIDTDEKIKRIKTVVDQNTGKIETVVEENKNIAKTSVTKDSFNVTVKELEDRIAGLTVDLGSILAEVKELNFKTTIAKGEDINTYEVDDVPTLSNYPVITDFYIWSKCSNNLYCSDTLICGVNDFKSHVGEVALNTKDNTYYIFDNDNGYHWSKLSDEEYAKLSNFYSSLKVEKDMITMECTRNNKTGQFILTENGFCCC